MFGASNRSDARGAIDTSNGSTPTASLESSIENPFSIKGFDHRLAVVRWSLVKIMTESMKLFAKSRVLTLELHDDLFKLHNSFVVVIHIEKLRRVERTFGECSTGYCCFAADIRQVG